MGRLIKAEFRKIVTTKLWLGLLLTALVVALLWAWMWSSAFDEIARDINRDLRRYAAVDLNDLSVNAIFLTRAINIATIFPMIFGGMALAVEIGRKTITTSFLTAPNRGTLLGAKAITYVLWGAIFGVVIILGASLGLLFGVGGEGMVDGEMWITIAASGLLSCVLWTLLGLGVGALIGSSVGTVVVLLVYGLLVGPGMDMTFAAISASNSEEIGPTVAGAFPNGAANGITGAAAASNIVGELEDMAGGTLPEEIVDRASSLLRFGAGALGSFGWGASVAIFLGWVLLFFGLGLARTYQRDIT
ncbi:MULTISPECIES: ABC transporter permease [Thermocrispum]|jgi:ABC-2 type transport system permease protein|uniref:ABC transporter permease n=1 Tax=Thermocrispum agreste TaxID=37925 RepID=A0A2W4LFC2_9PSEU|nr:MULTISPECIES: ABC transporter permease [Thermocrispum]PZM94346.1 MAG: ABC transporter permease [Thermocrispum agreste]